MQAPDINSPAQPEQPPSRAERRAVALAAFALLDDGSTVAATVVDLSYDGCKIETDAALPNGSWLKLSVLKLGVLDAQVRWCAGGKAGLCFKPETSETPQRQPRDHQRIRLTAELLLRRAGRHNYRAKVSDLSPAGCKMEFIERLNVGDRMWAKFDGLEALEAEVSWADGFHGGVRFMTPIHPAVFDLLLLNLGGGSHRPNS